MRPFCLEHVFKAQQDCVWVALNQDLLTAYNGTPHGVVLFFAASSSKAFQGAVSREPNYRIRDSFNCGMKGRARLTILAVQAFMSCGPDSSIKPPRWFRPPGPGGWPGFRLQWITTTPIASHLLFNVRNDFGRARTVKEVSGNGQEISGNAGRTILEIMKKAEADIKATG